MLGGVMKHIAVLTVLATSSWAVAGEPVYDKSPMVPPPAPSLLQWFAGGSVGYLLDNEEEMYHLHVGRELANDIGCWSPSVYLEVGYTELGGCFDQQIDPQSLAGEDFFFERICLDLEIIPVTLNYKLEQQVSNNLNWYVGVGAGVAFIDADATIYSKGTFSRSDDDTVFYAQAFTGLVYNVNPSFEVYGGVRYIYFDEPSFDFDGLSADWSDIESAFGFENEDVLVELGGRFNY